MTAQHHLLWITSRAAGSAALVCASISVAIGLTISRRAAGDRMTLKAAHESLSLATLVLVGIHGAALLGDSYLRPGVAGVLVPFATPYRPAWTAAGIVSGYGLSLLGLTYYLRGRVGPNRWKSAHRFVSVFWALGIAHTAGAGTDAGQVWFLVGMGCAVLPAAVLLAGRLARSAPATLTGDAVRDGGWP
ncbi:MAG: ferric reductase-like transmembrane domain-containing protein [Solirubrobacterales bacterium]